MAKTMTMSKKRKTQITLPSDVEIVVTRTFDAPRKLVWKLWTQAEHLTQWWGPEGWTLPVCEIDLRPGGTWFYCMQGPDNMLACGKAHYLEITEPERLVYQDTFVDSEGHVLEGMPVAQITIEFIEQDGVTTIIDKAVYETKADRDRVIEMGMEAGIDQTLDRLETYLNQVK